MLIDPRLVCFRLVGVVHEAEYSHGWKQISAEMDAPPLLRAIPAERVLQDGIASLLVARDGSVCFQFGRTIGKALMGKVKSAVLCSYGVDGRWRPEPHSPRFAVKQVREMRVIALDVPM